MAKFGTKSGAGVYQTLINLMPPHDTYVEGFLGTGAILRRKEPAMWNIGIDRNQETTTAFLDEYSAIDCEILNMDVFEWLETSQAANQLRTLIYLDPPYVHSTRKSKQRYKYELSDDDHRRLLDICLTLNSLIMISGYRCDLYDEKLSGWYSKDYPAMTRSGVVTETVWCNFEPGRMHWHTYAGEDCWDRQRIQRKAERWAKKFKKLPHGERQAILAALLNAEDSIGE